MNFELMKADRRKYLAGMALGLCGLACLMVYYTFRIAFYPSYDFDEVGFSNIAFRFASYGSLDYPIILDADGFNSSPIRKYPPIMALMLRSLVHGVIGFSAESTRVISAGFVALAVAALSWVIFHETRSLLLAASAAFISSLNPGTFHAARTMRLEQEILFLGAISIAAAAFVNPRWRAVIWAVCGLSGSWAALVYPWGLIFLAAILLSLTLRRGLWAERDALGYFPRLFLIAMGASGPVLITAYQHLHDWPEILRYAQAMRYLYAGRAETYAQSMALFFDGSIVSSIFPPAIAVKLYTISYSALASGIVVFSYVVWAQLAFVLTAGVVFFLKSRNLGCGLIVCLGLAVIAMSVVYPVGGNYSVYQNTLIPLAVAAAIPVMSPEGDLTRLLKVCRIAGVLIIVTTATATIYAHSRIAADIAAPRRLELTTLDEYYEFVERLGTELGMKISAATYCDLATWRACGKSTRSAKQAAVFALHGVPLDVDAVAVQQPFWGELIDSYPSLSNPSLTSAEKAARFDALTSSLDLAAVVLDGPRTTLFYTRQSPKRRPLSIVHLARHNETLRYSAIDVSEQCAEKGLEPGKYLAVATRHRGRAAALYDKSGSVLPIAWSSGNHAEKVAMVHVPSIVPFVCQAMPDEIRLYRLFSVE